jgi:hypothetical protein
MWGITITADASGATCGLGSSLLQLSMGANSLIDLTSAGSCSESTTIDYSAEITDLSVFSAANSGQTATITYTMF